MVRMILLHLLREVSWHSLSLAFFHAFTWTRIWIPLPLSPKQNPRYLKFRIESTLTVRLLSRFTFSFNVPSRGISYCFWAVSLLPVCSLPAVRYRLHSEYMALLVCGIASRTKNTPKPSEHELEAKAQTDDWPLHHHSERLRWVSSAHAGSRIWNKNRQIHLFPCWGAGVIHSCKDHWWQLCIATFYGCQKKHNRNKLFSLNANN